MAQVELVMIKGLALASAASLSLLLPAGLPHVFTNGQVADANQVNANFDALDERVGSIEQGGGSALRSELPRSSSGRVILALGQREATVVDLVGSGWLQSGYVQYTGPAPSQSNAIAVRVEVDGRSSTIDVTNLNWSIDPYYESCGGGYYAYISSYAPWIRAVRFNQSLKVTLLCDPTPSEGFLCGDPADGAIAAFDYVTEE